MLRIQTQLGHYYDVTDEGFIIRKDQPDFKASGQWVMRGIAGRLTREFFTFSTLNACKGSFGLTLKYKNGKPRYLVADIDHGTNRVWSDGVVALWKL